MLLKDDAAPLFFPESLFSSSSGRGFCSEVLQSAACVSATSFCSAGESTFGKLSFSVEDPAKKSLFVRHIHGHTYTP